LEITHSIFRTIETSNRIKVLWSKRSFIEYKKEAFDLFSNLLDKLKLDYVKILMNLKVYNEPTEKINQRQLKEKFKNLGKKTSRNDPCPCGSGKKFKKCCGAL